jgi:NAD(P)-dependent dehydrogenase (short-subunit alcohol dehydrogenase family)
MATGKRTALVTGAARRVGIGRAIALGLADLGFRVVVHGSGRPPSAEDERQGWAGAESVAREVRDLGGEAIAVEADLREPGAAAAAVSSAREQIGAITVLVNNAATAVGTGGGTIDELDDGDWYESFAVNVHSTFGFCKAVIPHMREAGEGSIVNVSATAGLRARPRYGPYCATKFAIVGFTQQLALELAPKIRVNCLCPGVTETDMLMGTFSRTEERLGMSPGELSGEVTSKVPLQRFADPAEMAKTVAWLVSDDSSYVTGQAIVVDGGMDLVSTS